VRAVKKQVTSIGMDPVKARLRSNGTKLRENAFPG